MINLLEKVFAPLTNLLGSGLEFFHSYGAPWWLSIALLTVIVRSLLFPLTVRQVKSMRAMQDLKPEMDKIRAKYKDNRQKQQEEIMKLYQDRKVNPFGSCFPLLVQMPIFITMFYVIRNFGSTHESFSTGGLLWFQNLSVHDPYYILPVLSAVTMLAASEITAKSVDPQQRWLMRILPVVFTIFLLNFPAGLFMYWIPSNLVTLVQNYVIYHHGPGRKGSNKADAQSAKLSESRKSAEKPTASSQNGSDKPQQKAAGASRSRRRRKKKK
jgi:YidC/Oxa1 family membrane protein insertase